ncbi:MAG TPA: hypothetical protein VLH19_04705 [Patescibacteria group bacterium]|nr:hypothetical protein [Patescibacteria group bacterium]
MAKTKAKRTTKRVSRATKSRAVSHRRTSAASSNKMWGMDQSMILVLSAGIVVLIVVGMYFSGWL